MSRRTPTEIIDAEPRAADGKRCRHPLAVGTMFGALSAVSYTAANVALRRAAAAGDVDWAVWVSCNKAVPAALAAWCWIGYRATKGLPALPPRRAVLPLLLTGLFMQFGGNVMFQYALSVVGLAVTVPLSFATLITTGALLGRIVLNEPVRIRTALAMATLIGAIMILSAGADDASVRVDRSFSTSQVAAAVMAACIAGTAYGACGVVIRGSVTRNVSLSATLAPLSSVGVLALGVVSLYRLGPERLTSTSTLDQLTMLVAGLFNAVAFFSVGKALTHMSVVRTNALNASQVAMAALFGVIFFDEGVTIWMVAGTALTVAGLLAMDPRDEGTIPPTTIAARGTD